MKRVVWGCNLHKDYDAYGPMSTLMWRKIGYEPLVLLIGEPEEWLAWRGGAIIKGYEDLEVDVRFINKVHGFSSVIQSKLVRWFACQVQGLPKESVLLTADIDIWPLDRKWFDQHDPDLVATLYHSNCHGTEQHATCYIQADIGGWREISDCGRLHSVEYMLEYWLKDQSREGKRSVDWEGWRSDEKFFAWRWQHVYGYPYDFRMIKSNLSKCRIDRGNWPSKLDLKGKVDAHLPRPVTDKRVWKMVRPLLEAKLCPQDLTWCDGYISGVTS